jgi:hypothetical protein
MVLAEERYRNCEDKFYNFIDVKIREKHLQKRHGFGSAFFV